MKKKSNIKPGKKSRLIWADLEKPTWDRRLSLFRRPKNFPFPSRRLDPIDRNGNRTLHTENKNEALYLHTRRRWYHCFVLPGKHGIPSPAVTNELKTRTDSSEGSLQKFRVQFARRMHMQQTTKIPNRCRSVRMFARGIGGSDRKNQHARRKILRSEKRRFSSARVLWYKMYDVKRRFSRWGRICVCVLRLFRRERI